MGATSASPDGRGNTAVGEQAGKKKKKKKKKKADWSTEKRINVRRENILELRKALDGKKGSVRNTCKSQPEAKDNVCL